MPKINPKHFRVTIFGSARIKRGDRRYKMVYSLAKGLAHEGIDVVTGGGPGLMDAASHGHHAGRKEKGTHTIGLAIHLPKEQRDSYHLDIKREFHRFSRRLDSFMQLSDAVVVAPGGIGTLLELVYTWQLVQVKHICTIPIILLGSSWTPLLQWIKKEMLHKKLMNPDDFNSVYHVHSYREALAVIKKFHKARHEGEICLNYTKYQVLP